MIFRSQHARPGSRFRRGLTLIEMLVAVAVTLILIFALAEVFAMLGDNISKGRSIIEMSGQLRSVSHRLQQDLDGATANTLPWANTAGYLEYIERPRTDKTAPNSMWGDADDVLMFTARSKGRPFVGRYNGNVIESELAEIVWYTISTDNGTTAGSLDMRDTTLLYRRVLLIRPDITVTGSDILAFQAANDLSVRVENGQLKTNSLDDLALRQNRFGHDSNTFPHTPLNFAGTDLSGSFTPLTGNDLGHDVVLNNVLAFDVQVYDPLAPVRSAGGTQALVPSDAGWATAGTEVGRGAYVDLIYAGNRTTSFYSGLPNSKSQFGNVLIYDTWPLHYEQDGENQDFADDMLIDEGKNGFDDGGVAGAADDVGEYETSPPYPHPASGITGYNTVKTPGLSGLQVRLRIFEADSRQVRQVTVASDFASE